eukprot:CAMPEP_0171064242 /NCGR_PEP_ID=MMETSP0766_2-20121228/6160_1 /TAXON_ID=439317 /ORGANISM="Gambierdiscus australes, Strain CAWD 149" /LENGTH=402 /DNA_ID=CAMNT_0011520249 /DNA_START=150 /DNA_END=1356 /DNA_ORIENTATION=+
MSLPSPLGAMRTSYPGGEIFAGIPVLRKRVAKAAENASSLLVVLGLWVLFVLNRALHPLIIDLSKGADGKMHYSKLSPVIAKCFLSVLVCNVISLFDRRGWREGLRQCYGVGGSSMRVFGSIGALYACGDYLEMMSMASMNGAAYQVLLQSKLIITALMMWIIKGKSAQQTAAQWSVLVTVSIGMALFMLVQPKAGGKGSAGGLVGTCFVLCKVVVSCYSAVKADQSLKAFKHLPLYAQLSQLMASWGIVSVVMVATLDPAVVSSASGFFHGWNYATVLTVASFAMKTVLTMTLLKVLDSVQKNIGEAIAMLVIYFGQVLLPAFSQEFEVNTFLAMLIVVVAVTTYMLLKQEKQKASEAAVKHDGPDAKSRPRKPAFEGKHLRAWVGMQQQCQQLHRTALFV